MAHRRLVRLFQNGFGLMLRNATHHRRPRDEPHARPRKRPNCGRAERGAVTAVAAHRVSHVIHVHVIHVVCRRHWPVASGWPRRRVCPISWTKSRSRGPSDYNNNNSPSSGAWRAINGRVSSGEL